MKTFAPDIKQGQKVKVKWASPSKDKEKVFEIGCINGDRTKALLVGLFGEYNVDHLEILRGELKEFKNEN